MAALVEITKSELLDALFNATKDAPKEAKTVQQLCELTGWGKNKVRDAIGRLAMQDRIEVYSVQESRIDGHASWKPAYTILPPKKKARR